MRMLKTVCNATPYPIVARADDIVAYRAMFMLRCCAENEYGFPVVSKALEMAPDLLPMLIWGG